MASAFSKWLDKQKKYYSYQKALGERDKFISRTLKDMDATFKEINSDRRINDFEKEEKKLEYMKNTTLGAKGVSAMYSDLQAKVMEPLSKSTSTSDLDAKGKGIGGFFGRLFNGRFLERSITKSEQQFERFTTEAGFTRQQEERLNKIKADKEEARNLLQGAKVSPTSPDKLSELRNRAASELHSIDPNMPQKGDEYHYERQAYAFMKPEDPAHNQRVLRALKDKPMDFSVMGPIMRAEVDKIKGIDISNLKPSNEQGLKQVYPQLEEAMFKVHLIADLKKEMTKEQNEMVFGDENAQRDYGARLGYIGALRAGIRGRLFEIVGNDTQYMTKAEIVKNQPDRPLSQALHQTATGPNGIPGDMGFEEFKAQKIQRELGNQPTQNISKKEVSVNGLMENKKMEVSKVSEPHVNMEHTVKKI